MKIGVMLIFLLLIPIATAIEIDMKDSFDKGETFMTKISGNFEEPILKQNIYFYRGHVRVSIEPEVANIEDEFYIYAKLPETQNNYSLQIEGTRYYSGSQIIDDEIEQNFSITENTADFSVDPGFVTTNNDFSIEVQNLQNNKIIIDISTTTNSGSTQGFLSSLFGSVEEQDKNSIELKSGEIKQIKFQIDPIEQDSFKTIKLSTGDLEYKIPVYIFANKSFVKKEKKFKLEPAEPEEINIATNSETLRTFYLYNTGDDILQNITLTISDELKPFITISPEHIEEIDIDSNERIELLILSDFEEKSYEGQLKAKENTDEIYTYSLLRLNFLKDFIPEDNPPIETVNYTSQTCDEMTGTICQEDQECEGEEKYAKDDVCCLGECKTTSPSPIGKIIGWSLFVLVIAFATWFYFKKYKGAS